MLLSDMQTMRKDASNRIVSVAGFNPKIKYPTGPVLGNNTYAHGVQLKHKKS